MQKEIENRKRNRVDIELMRIIAAFFVIFNHDEGFWLFAQYSVGSKRFYVYLFMSLFCKFAVPLYLMISGALLFSREPEGIKNVYIKRIFRMVLSLVVVSTLYYSHNVYMHPETDVFNLKTLLVMIYSSNKISVHLGFIYTYIAFLVATPLLYVLAHGMDDRLYRYVFFIAIMLDVLSIIGYKVSSGTVSLNIKAIPEWMIGAIVLFPLAGFYLENRVKITRNKLLLLWGVNLVSLAVCCYMVYFNWKVNGWLDQAFHGYFLVLHAGTIYITVKYCFERYHLNFYIEKAILSMGSCTFGIYLLHQFFNQGKIENIVRGTLNALNVNQMVTCLIWCGTNFMICYMITFVLKKIPLIKKCF